MSGQTSTVAPKATTALDPAEVEKFKKRSQAGRAAEIETANENVGQLEGDIETKEALLVGLKVTEKNTYNNAKSIEAARMKKSKLGQPTLGEINAKETTRVAAEACETADTDLAALKVDLSAAQAKLVKLSREGYIENTTALIKRLPQGIKSLQAVDATAQADLKRLLDAKDYDGFDTLLAELADNVRIAVAATDLPKVHSALSARLTTLQKQPVLNPAALKSLAARLRAVNLETPTGPALAKLETETTAAFEAAEAEVQAVLDLMSPIDASIRLMERNGVAEAAAHREEFGSASTLPKPSPIRRRAA